MEKLIPRIVRPVGDKAKSAHASRFPVGDGDETLRP